MDIFRLCVFISYIQAISGGLLACKSCPLGFEEAGSSCYMNKPAEVTFSSAHASCTSHNAHLVAFETTQELTDFQAWVQTLSGVSNVWSEGIKVNGAYQWKSSGTAISAAMWGPGQPDLKQTNVIASSNTSFSLEDSAADAKHSAVCETDPAGEFFSSKSATTEGASVKVSCPSGCVATSCDCGDWQHCRGSKFQTDECTALNKNGGFGVYAKIGCEVDTNYNNRFTTTTNLGGLVLSPNVTCPQGSTMTGCSSYTTSDLGKSPVIDGDTCRTNGSCTSVGCTVQARCQVTSCGNPGPFSTGTRLTGTDFFINGTVSISCSDGFTSPGGATTAQCQDSGSWSQSLINCTDVNECASNPCQNGAACVDEVNQFSCTCASGFEGTLCENEITTAAPSTTESRNSTTPSMETTTDDSFDLFGNYSDLDLVMEDTVPIDAYSAKEIGFSFLSLIWTVILVMAIADIRTVYLDSKQAARDIRSGIAAMKASCKKKKAKATAKVSPAASFMGSTASMATGKKDHEATTGDEEKPTTSNPTDALEGEKGRIH